MCTKKKKFSHFENFLTEFDFFRLKENDIFKFALTQAGYYSIENHNYLFHLYLSISSRILPYAGIDYLIEKAFSRKIDIYILTNGISEAQKNKWRNLDLVNKSKITFQPSREIGKDKPCNETFIEMFKIINRSPQEVIFIGDRYENDIKWGLDNNSKGFLINSLHDSNIVRSFQSPINLWDFIEEII